MALSSLSPGAAAANALAVSKADHDDWLYNVPSGRLVCVQGALLFESGTQSYALNDAALERGYEPALALVDRAVLEEHQFAQYFVRWEQQWRSGGPAARSTYGPALIEATTPKSLRRAGAKLCD